MVNDSPHQTHAGELGLLGLAESIWFHCIHRDVTYKAQSCLDCITNGKNGKLKLGTPILTEPNEEIQMIFAGPLTLMMITNSKLK